MTKLEAWKAWCATAGTDRLADEFTLDNSSHGKAFSFAWGAAHEACAKVCDSISEDQWALYKGRSPYTGKEIERASDYTQGKSDGAEVCAAAIRARGETK